MRHAMRVRRGGEPGCESATETLLARALAVADVPADEEADGDFAAALGRLEGAALAYARSRGWRPPGPHL
jgi:hypothetical protein